MIAALPMYDMPGLRDATDALWTAIAARLRATGVDAPEMLTRSDELYEIWLRPDLLLSQTCGLPYRTKLHRHVTLVATPDYGLPGCPPGMYCSVIVARDGTPGDPARLDGARLAYNDALSQSGWAAPLHWAGQRGIRFGELVHSGSHRASAQAIADGQADLAAIDAVTWRLLRRFEPWTSDFREIARTPPSPGLPLITAPRQDAETLATAVDAAITDLGHDTRTRLGLTGLARIDKTAYLSQPTPPSPEDYLKSLGI